MPYLAFQVIASKRMRAYPAGTDATTIRSLTESDTSMPKVALTDRFVAGAKPDSTGRTDYFDAGTKGLALRVSDGAKTWTYHFTSPKYGKRARLKIGTYPALSLARA